MPTTAIIAAMPIAMPSADRNTRSGRARRPAPPTRSTSRRPPAGRAAPRRSRRGRRHDRRSTRDVESRMTGRRASATWRGRLGRDLPVVGDDQDGGTRRRAARAAAPSPRRRTAESRLPVGSSASSRAGSPTTARAMATRCRSPPESSCGRWSSRCPSPTRVSAASARRRRWRQRYAGVEQPVGHVVHAPDPGGQVELLEHEADPAGPQRRQLPVGQPRPRRGRRRGRCRTWAGPACRSGAAWWTCRSRTARRSRPVRRTRSTATRPRSGDDPARVRLAARRSSSTTGSGHAGIPTISALGDAGTADLDPAVGEQAGRDRHDSELLAGRRRPARRSRPRPGRAAPRPVRSARSAGCRRRGSP